MILGSNGESALKPAYRNRERGGHRSDRHLSFCKGSGEKVVESDVLPAGNSPELGFQGLGERKRKPKTGTWH